MSLHKPVLAKEVLQFFKGSGHIIDGTLGNGGHTKLFLDSGLSVTGLDRNEQSIKESKIQLSKYDSVKIYQDNFINFPNYLQPNTVGVFLDLGLSTPQLKDHNLGLSFTDSTLDMRLDLSLPETAQHIINTYSTQDLVYIFSKYAQEKKSIEIVREIIKSRPISSALELSQLVEKVYKHRGKIHPATKIFMALRIVVNREYENLEYFLKQTLDLQKGQKIGIITFHSGEDRIVKNFTINNKNAFKVNPVLSPTYLETKANPASRSAIFRTFEKC